MVCFCDIPLARISEHISFYGEFGIGVTRTWAEKNNLNPVIYLSRDTPISSALARLLRDGAVAANRGSGFNGHYENSGLDVNSVISYVKPVSGSISIDGAPTDKDFYQENEWRYVPSKSEINMWISKENHLNEEVLKANNDNSKLHGSLKLEPCDIVYIFVKSDSDIPIVVDYIQTELGDFSGNDLKILVSRVTSTESISVDL